MFDPQKVLVRKHDAQLLRADFSYDRNRFRHIDLLSSCSLIIQSMPLPVGLRHCPRILIKH